MRKNIWIGPQNIREWGDSAWIFEKQSTFGSRKLAPREFMRVPEVAEWEILREWNLFVSKIQLFGETSKIVTKSIPKIPQFQQHPLLLDDLNVFYCLLLFPCFDAQFSSFCLSHPFSWIHFTFLQISKQEYSFFPYKREFFSIRHKKSYFSKSKMEILF